MDLRGSDSQGIQIENLVKRMLQNVHTSIPGTIVSFDPATQTATVRVDVKKSSMIGDKKEYKELPPLVKCPVVFPNSQSKGFAVTMPVSAGDSVLVNFSESSIDKWQQFGGVQEPEGSIISRNHDLTDAIATIGLSPDSSNVSGYSTDSVCVRNKDGKTAVEVWDDKVQCRLGDVTLTIEGTTITAKCDEFVIDAPLTTMTGVLRAGTETGAASYSEINGTLRATVDLLSNGISGAHHTHTGVETGPSSTGEPQ